MLQKKLNNLYNSIMEDKLRKHFTIGALILFAFLLGLSFFNIGKTNLLYVYNTNNDELLGVVEAVNNTVTYEILDKNSSYTGKKTLENLNDEINKDAHTLGEIQEGVSINIEIPSIKFSLVTNKSIPKDITPSYDNLIENILKDSTIYYKGYEVYLDNEPIEGLAKTEDVIQSALNNIMAQYDTPKLAGTITELSFLEDVQIKEVYSTNKTYLTVEEIEEVLTEPVIVQKTHTVVSGDSLWQISWDNDISLDDLIGLNPDTDENSYLQIGDILTLQNEKPRLSTISAERVEYRGTSYRDIETVENPNEYKNWSRIIEEGSDGESYFTVDVLYKDGNEETRKVIEEVVIVPSTRQLVEVGTLNIPPKKAIGTFVWPTYGRISDTFGTRGGRHMGIDVAVPTGTPIYAADGGYVEFAGWQSGYGYLVIVNHENGFKTYYAHNSRFHVSQGERVRQGQIVAAAGSTGRSTGPHLHFEIRVNGVPRNPSNYLGGSYQ